MKKRPVILIALLLLLLPSISFSQEKKVSEDTPVFVTGIVFNLNEMKPLQGAVLLINHRLNSTSDNDGRFSFWSSPGDTITAHYLGYKEVNVVVPDTLSAPEYLMGFFMSPDTVRIKEVIIFPRSYNLMSEMKEIPINEKMLQNAQQNVNLGTVQGLTKSPTTYDAEMNTRNTLRKYQMNAQYKGMLATPGNSVSVSTNSLGPNTFLFGKPILHKGKLRKKMISSNESDVVIGRYQAYLARKYKKMEDRKTENTQ